MDKLKDKKLYLLMGILVIIILIVLRSLITSQNNAIIDYSETTSGIHIIQKGKVTKDREVYFIIQDILENMSGAYTESNLDEITIEDYYDVLNKSYRNYIGKTKYLELMDNFFNKLTYTDTSGMGVYTNIQITGAINSIYELAKDTYICMLQLTDTSDIGYFGVKLTPDDNTFEIFYLE